MKSEIRNPKSEGNPKPFGYSKLTQQLYNLKPLLGCHEFDAKTQRRKDAKENAERKNIESLTERNHKHVLKPYDNLSKFPFLFARLCAFALKQKFTLNHQSHPLSRLRNSDFGFRISDLTTLIPQRMRRFA